MSEQVEVTSSNFDSVVNQAKPVFVLFHLETHGHSHLVKGRLASSGVNHVVVNAGSLKDVAAKYNVRQIPTLILFKAGKPEAVLSGLVSEETIKSAINS